MAKEIRRNKVYGGSYTPPKVVLECKEPSKTRQSEKASADINVIVKRFEREGVISVNTRPGLFLDVSEMGDYREALAQVAMADEFFMNLPSELRARFKNDAGEFLDFVSNPANKPEMEKLGLLGSVAAEAAPVASNEASSAS